MNNLLYVTQIHHDSFKPITNHPSYYELSKHTNPLWTIQTNNESLKPKPMMNDKKPLWIIQTYYEFSWGKESNEKMIPDNWITSKTSASLGRNLAVLVHRSFLCWSIAFSLSIFLSLPLSLYLSIYILTCIHTYIDIYIHRQVCAHARVWRPSSETEYWEKNPKVKMHMYIYMTV